MGFNSTTTLEFVFGLLLPAILIILYFCSKNRSTIAYDAAAYGFLSFVGSLVAVFLVFVLVNALFMSSFSFTDPDDGMTIAGILISILILALGIVCESLKMMTIKHFLEQETRNKMSGIAFAAGVIIAQNAALFVALNIFKNYDMTPGYALVSGAILLVTGIMYTVLAAASEIMLRENYKAPAYALSFVYYLYWVLAIFSNSSTILIYIITAFFFALSLILSGVFIVRYKSKV